jgi:hypothetical protein
MRLLNLDLTPLFKQVASTTIIITTMYKFVSCLIGITSALQMPKSQTTDQQLSQLEVSTATEANACKCPPNSDSDTPLI